jgi:DNA-binding transcriptional ArsR family regulator
MNTNSNVLKGAFPMPKQCEQNESTQLPPLHRATDELICDLADLFKIFGDTTRMRILYALQEGEMSVGTISAALGMTQSAISHQLKVLKSNNLITNRREGKTIYYFLADDHVRTIVAMGYEHLTEE